MTVLVIAEHDNASIKGATLNAVSAASQLGGDVHVLVAGQNAAAAAQAASQIVGVAKVLHADGASLAHGLAENVAAQVLAIAGGYSHLVFAATASGKNVAPRVAAKLDVAQLSEITKVVSADTFERPIYAGNAIATVQSSDAVKVITVRGTAFDAAAATGGSAAVETITAVGDAGSSAFVGNELAKSERPELTAAKVIVSGGRALEGGVVVFGNDKHGHDQITFASFFSLATRVATSGTLMPAPRLGGSSTFKVARRGATSTPKAAGAMVSMGFFLAFMMLGRVA